MKVFLHEVQQVTYCPLGLAELSCTSADFADYYLKRRVFTYAKWVGQSSLPFPVTGIFLLVGVDRLLTRQRSICYAHLYKLSCALRLSYLLVLCFIGCSSWLRFCLLWEVFEQWFTVSVLRMEQFRQWCLRQVLFLHWRRYYSRQVLLSANTSCTQILQYFQEYFQSANTSSPQYTSVRKYFQYADPVRKYFDRRVHQT